MDGGRFPFPTGRSTNALDFGGYSFPTQLPLALFVRFSRIDGCAPSNFHDCGRVASRSNTQRTASHT